MAADDPSDLFMTFIKGTKPVEAASRVDLQWTTTSARMLKDIKRGCVFEIDKFTFGAGTVDDGDNDKGKDSAGGGENGRDNDKKKDSAIKHDKDNSACLCHTCGNFLGSSSELSKKKAAAEKGTKKPDWEAAGPLSTGRSYKSWRDGIPKAYPVEFHPVTFSRRIDSGSMILMQNFLDVLYYDRVILIKRKAVGGASAGETFLRYDFSNVLVVSMDWGDDDEVEETCRFICRAVTISYRPQLPDGSLGAIVPAFFSLADDEKQVNL